MWQNVHALNVFAASGHWIFEILIEKEENEFTRKKNENYAEHSSANMKQVVSLEMESIQRSHKRLLSTLSTALFHGDYITGKTFNVHVAANS